MFSAGARELPGIDLVVLLLAPLTATQGGGVGDETRKLAVLMHRLWLSGADYVALRKKEEMEVTPGQPESDATAVAARAASDAEPASAAERFGLAASLAARS